MKAIVRILRGGNAKMTVAYLLDPDAKSKRHAVPKDFLRASGKLEQKGERVAKVFGDGIDCNVLTKRNEKLIVHTLEDRPSTLRRKGKGTRHVVISAEFEEGDELTDDEINEKLQFAAEDFVDTFCPSSKFLGVIHRDSSQPHVHLEIENYDLSITEDGSEPQRLNWLPVDAAEMQSMNWTKGFKMGKGSTKNEDKKIAEDIVKEGRPLLGRKETDKELGKEVEAKLGNLKLRGEKLIDEIEKLDGFTVKRFSSRGALLKNPSMSFGGTTVTFARLEKHLDNVLECAKDVATDIQAKRIVKEVNPAVLTSVKSSREVAIEFMHDYEQLMTLCKNAEGGDELEKKLLVRAPAVRVFLAKWSDVSNQLTTAKNRLKEQLNTFLDQLKEFLKPGGDTIKPIYTHTLKSLRTLGRENEKPAKNTRTTLSKEACHQCRNVNCSCNAPEL